MSLIKKCDLCGRIIRQNKIEPLKIQLPSKDKHDYNFYISVRMEDVRDSKLIKDFQKIMKNLGINDVSDFDNKMLSEEEYLKIIEMEENINTKLNNPKPHLCQYCIREVLKMALRYGSFKKMKNPIN